MVLDEKTGGEGPFHGQISAYAFSPNTLPEHRVDVLGVVADVEQLLEFGVRGAP